MICTQEDKSKFTTTIVNVYDRNNMAEVKDVIALPDRSGGYRRLQRVKLRLCTFLKSRYIPSVLRITKDGEHQFNISPWISDVRPCNFFYLCTPKWKPLCAERRRSTRSKHL